jgi:hypothetical protein
MSIAYLILGLVCCCSYCFFDHAPVTVLSGNGCVPITGGQWQVALPIFYSMQLMGLRRDGITYCSTISALAKGNQAARAVEVWLICSNTITELG